MYKEKIEADSNFLHNLKTFVRKKLPDKKN